MNSGKTVFSQLIDYVPFYEFKNVSIVIKAIAKKNPIHAVNGYL